MQISAEIRWFWPETPPPSVESWFCNIQGNIIRAGGGKVDRADEYLRDEMIELGIKRRGGETNSGIEIKGLVVDQLSFLSEGPFVGPIELWTKWISSPLRFGEAPTIVVSKRRWLRKFDTSMALPREVELDTVGESKHGEPPLVRGCNVELTRVKVSGLSEIWWTFGLEAYGTIQTAESDLREVAGTLNERQPPDLKGGLIAGYPAWLKKILQR